MRTLLPSVLILPHLAAGEVVITVEDAVQHPIDVRIFGQFLERPTWGGETGPEAFVRADGTLPPALVEALRGMRIPVVRFPGGTDIDRTDWTDMVSQVPGRGAERPPTRGVSNRFGYDEFGGLAAELGWETILVVNLLDGMAARKPLAEAARHAAGQVAYWAAPVGAALPQGMADWPRVRAGNGHPQPRPLRYVQLGNEWWMESWVNAVEQAKAFPDAAARAAWYREVIAAYCDAIRAVAPEVEIIADGVVGKNASRAVWSHPELKRRVQWLTFHAYAPGDIGDSLAGRKADACWRAYSAMPGQYDRQGLCIAGHEDARLAKELGYRTAMTEWNWNGWGMEKTALKDWHLPAALGTAANLHGMLRQGVGLATQSMLVGTTWNITALRMQGDAVVRLPQGEVTAFYRTYAGDALLIAKTDGAAPLPGTVRVGWAPARTAVARIDALATRAADGWRLLIVHRGDADQVVSIALPASAQGGTLHALTAEPDPAGARRWLRQSDAPIAAGGARIVATLPAHSVCAVVLRR